VNIAYPYGFDATGRTATVDDDVHLRDMIAQVLFTAPGERVMRPDFGSGLLNLVFEPNSLEVAATTEFLIRGALQQFLGHLIGVQSVEVANIDGAFQISVSYTINRTQQQQTDQFSAPGAPT
jgi:uncharacterized protein